MTSEMNFYPSLLACLVAINCFHIAIALPQHRLDSNRYVSTGTLSDIHRRTKPSGQYLSGNKDAHWMLSQTLCPTTDVVRFDRWAAEASLYDAGMTLKMNVMDLDDRDGDTVLDARNNPSPDENGFFSRDLGRMSRSLIAPLRRRTKRKKYSTYETTFKQRILGVPQLLQPHPGWSQVPANQFWIVDLSHKPGIEAATCKNTIILLLDNFEGRESKKVGMASLAGNVENTLGTNIFGVQAVKNAIQGDAFLFLASKDHRILAKNVGYIEGVLRASGAKTIHQVLYDYDDTIRYVGVDNKMTVSIRSFKKSIEFRAKHLASLLNDQEFPRHLPRDPSSPLNLPLNKLLKGLLKASYEKRMRGGVVSESVSLPAHRAESSQDRQSKGSSLSSGETETLPQMHSDWPNVKAGQIKYADLNKVGGIEVTDFVSETGFVLLEMHTNRALVANIEPRDMESMVEFETLAKHHCLKGNYMVGIIYAMKDSGRSTVNNILELEKTLHHLGASIVRTLPYVPSDYPGYLNIHSIVHQQAKLEVYSEGRILSLDPWEFSMTERDFHHRIVLESEANGMRTAHERLQQRLRKSRSIVPRTSPKSSKSDGFFSVLGSSDRSTVAHTEALHTHTDWEKLFSWDAKYADFSSSKGIETVINSGTTGVILLGKKSAVMASVGPWSLVEMHRLRFLAELHRVQSDDAVVYWTLRHGKSLTPHSELARIIRYLREIGVKSVVQVGHEVWSESTYIREGYLGVSQQLEVIARVQDQILTHDAKDINKFHGMGLPQILFEQIERSPTRIGHNTVDFQDKSPEKSSAHSKVSHRSQHLSSRAFNSQRSGPQTSHQSTPHRGRTLLSDPDARFVELRSKAVEATFSGRLGIIVFGNLHYRSIIISSIGQSIVDALNELEAIVRSHRLSTSAIIYVGFSNGRQIHSRETVKGVEQLLRDLDATPVIFSYDTSMEGKGRVEIDTDMRVNILTRSGWQHFDARDIRRMQSEDFGRSTARVHVVNRSDQAGYTLNESNELSQLQRRLFSFHRHDDGTQTQHLEWIKVFPGDAKYADLRKGKSHGVETILGGQTGVMITNEARDQAILACIDPHDLSAAHDLGMLAKIHGVHAHALVWKARSHGRLVASNHLAIEGVLHKIQVQLGLSFYYDVDRFYKFVGISALDGNTLRHVPIGTRLQRTPASTPSKRALGFFPASLHPRTSLPRRSPLDENKPPILSKRSESSTASNSPLSDSEVNSSSHPPHHFKPNRPAAKRRRIVVEQGDVGFADLQIAQSIECYAFKENTGVILFDQQRALIASVPPNGGGHVLQKLEDLAREKHLIGQAAILSPSNSVQRADFDWRHLGQVVETLRRTGTSRWKSYVYGKWAPQPWNVVIDHSMKISVFGRGKTGAVSSRSADGTIEEFK